MDIEILTHSSIRIKAREGTIYVDPFEVNEVYHDADFIFITHEHYDHYSPRDIEKVVGNQTILVIPRTMEEKVSDVAEKFSKIEMLAPKDKERIKHLQVEAIPAYNVEKKHHQKGNKWLGYKIKLEGKWVYIAGDTDENEDNTEIECDVAILPIGGTYTMDAKAAAEFVNHMKPEIVIPTHYGTVVGCKEDAELFKNYVDEGIEVQLLMK
ncbi:MAG: MBL fold metallo-hydrolase [Lachnospiraceae bacterium]|jgi:L-ascorbate metabolism protein UlaG (beta-lactamase superfamily)|nr:MBL fold metallo-hydrolase [Lachnospiraceae bacterium]